MKALLTFPCGIGLGWDALHPRALTRLPSGILLAIMQLLALCESAGRWPKMVQLVIIVLLPKSEGGVRPIGLLPMPVRLWMTARRNVLAKWDKHNHRPDLYAGRAWGQRRSMEAGRSN